MGFKKPLLVIVLRFSIHAIYKNKEQSSNYIFDITKSNINMKEALELANILILV